MGADNNNKTQSLFSPYTLGIIILLGPFVIIFLLFICVRLLTLTSFDISPFWINTNEFKVSLVDYVYFYFYGLGATTTGILSYAILKASLDAMKREKAREDQSKIENSLIVYYDILIGFEDIKKLYISKMEYQKGFSYSISPARLYFSNEWIKNVALLENITEDDRKSIYEMYGKFENVAEVLRSGKQIASKFTTHGYSSESKEDSFLYPDELYVEINSCIDHLFEPIFPKEFYKHFKSINMLKSYYRELLVKINPNENEVSNFVEEEYFDDGKLFYKVIFVDNKPTSIKMYNPEKHAELYYYGETYIGDDDEYLVKNGFFTEKIGRIIHSRIVKDKIDDGLGMYRIPDEDVIAVGKWKNKLCIDGTFFNINRGSRRTRNIIYFVGKFEFNDVHFTIIPADGFGYLLEFIDGVSTIKSIKVIKNNIEILPKLETMTIDDLLEKYKVKFYEEDFYNEISKQLS